MTRYDVISYTIISYNMLYYNVVLGYYGRGRWPASPSSLAAPPPAARARVHAAPMYSLDYYYG